MTDMLQEFCDSRGVRMRVDAQAGVIRGVKVLGLESRNGRTYLPEALAEAARLYEDAKVNVNHPKGNPTGPRDYQDRIGTVRGVAMQPGAGLFADFHFNPKHALAEQLIWDAEHAPENVGFSHNVEARLGRRGERVVVEAITRVQSVDLVADPATTRGLFESAVVDAVPSSTSEGDSPIFVERQLGQSPSPIFVEQKLGQCPPSVETIKPLGLDDLKRDYPELVEAIRGEQAAEVGRLQQEVERLAALEAAQQKHRLASRLLREFELPDPETAEPWAKTVVSRQFLESLWAAPDEPAMRVLVEERARLVRALAGPAETRPQSRDQHLVYAVGASDTKSFVEAIT